MFSLSPGTSAVAGFTARVKIRVRIKVRVTVRAIVIVNVLRIDRLLVWESGPMAHSPWYDLGVGSRFLYLDRLGKDDE
jgi:hypothetical protein